MKVQLPLYSSTPIPLLSIGKAPGDCLKLKDVKCTIADNKEYQNLSKKCKEKLMDGLEEHQKQKWLSICSMHHRVALDVQGSIGRVQYEMST